jgi:hypothetical protein
MSSPNAYPDEKKEPVLGYNDGEESDGEVTSFTAIIAEGENSYQSIKHSEPVPVH